MEKILIHLLIGMLVGFPIVTITMLLSDTYISGATAGIIFAIIMDHIDIEIDG